jgi:uncharacterized protein YbbC (DUF1343 family)
MKRLFLFLTLILAGTSSMSQSARLMTGADQLDLLLPKLSGKRVALVVNQTAMIKKTHLVDTLKSRGINVIKVFAPEHGFRGDAADGEEVNDSVDTRTGIRIASLYGKNRKPAPEQLEDVDVVVFDIQDVGCRFYTYTSTMHYVMEACAENNKKLIVLDRPNPNAFVDGPIMQKEFMSFVGMHPIPIAYGLSIGELGMMINGEGWLAEKKKCNLEVVKLRNWKHSDPYAIPVRPSPNLPNDQAIRLYPSICLFEGTQISLGRGTEMPFQVLGNPNLLNMPFEFKPVSIKGVSTSPPQENKLCRGIDLRAAPTKREIDLSYLLDFYRAYPDKEKFFIPYFEKLAGTKALRKQIIDGLSAAEIKKSWAADLEKYSVMRKKYLLYPD